MPWSVGSADTTGPGAGRWRILRQLFTESLVLGLAGAIGGVIVAYAGLRLLMSAGAGQLPRLNDLRLDGATMLFSLAASVVTAPTLPSPRVYKSRRRRPTSTSGACCDLQPGRRCVDSGP